MMDTMRGAGVAPTRRFFGALMRACCDARDHECALETLEVMRFGA